MSLLSLKGLSKSFGGLMAVNDVSFDLTEGSILG
ncbi:MAG TPA: ABC transporter ATP-binding protein, partial [Syntrophobacteria bacterium]|nr:ABC transporter ATP-binding protein [Syntrophobacteria bacterium]